MATKTTNNNTHTIKIDGQDREVFMSFGLLNDLTKLVLDPSDVPSMIIDPELRSSVLKELLAERKPTGKVLKPVEDIDDLDTTIDEIEKLLDWAMEHVMSFFIRLLTKTTSMGQRHATGLSDLRSSLDGLKDSASKTS